MIEKVKKQEGLWEQVYSTLDKIDEIIDIVNKLTEPKAKVETKKENAMTPNEVRIALGFKPFDEFEYEQLCNLEKRTSAMRKDLAIKERIRQTGRTTKIMCDVLAAISNGNEVILIGENASITYNLNAKIVEYAKKLMLNTDLITMMVIGLDKSKVKVFYDHPLP